jgi:hypothetical protein
VAIGFDLEFDDVETEYLIDKQDELLKCCGEKEFEGKIADDLDSLDSSTLAIVKEYGKLLAMTDEEFAVQQGLNSEFRDALRALLKK